MNVISRLRKFILHSNKHIYRKKQVFVRICIEGNVSHKFTYPIYLLDVTISFKNKHLLAEVHKSHSHLSKNLLFSGMSSNSDTSTKEPPKFKALKSLLLV